MEQEIELEVRAEVTSRDKVRALEIIKNGRVDRRISYAEWQKRGSLGKLRFKESGWFLVRAIADNSETFRFASTAPFYVEIGSMKRRVSRTSARFFLDWTSERAKRVNLGDPRESREVLHFHDMSRRFWLRKLAEATTG